MTYQALNTAISGLRAAQQQLSVISNNVTNATTPGYNRQIAPQKTQVLRESGTTVGVLTQNVIRQVDMNLQRDLWTQISASSMQDVQVQYLQQIQNFNGPPDKGFSIAAKLADLRDSFSALSDIPDDPQALEATVHQASVVADKFNDYAELLTQLRNDAQNDLQTSVNTVNNLLQEITNINTNIRGAEHIGNSVAGLQDQRDIAIKELAKQMDISFFQRADGVLVVQTREGQELAGDVAHRLQFEAEPISANQYYPETASGLFLINETNSGRITRTDLTERVVGGNLGGLIELRDDTIPSYQAQLDELAYQTAYRLDLQGLKLFTDQNGYVPENTPPDPNTLPLPTPVPYVDFARVMKVNKNIIGDPSLLQRGTYNPDVVIPSGDNSVIRRVLEFGFGEVHYQEAIGTIDLTDGGANTELQRLLGLDSTNNVVLGLDFTSFPEVDDSIDGTNDLMETFREDFLDYFAPPGGDQDQFRITFEENDGGAAFAPIELIVDLDEINNPPFVAPGTFDIGQPTVPPGGTINNAADQLTSYINQKLTTLPAFANSTQAFATTNNYGQIVLQSTGNITIDRDPLDPLLPEAMSETALAALGIEEASYEAEDPSFTVQVGNNEPYTITIAPGDDIDTLVDKLTLGGIEAGIPGLFVEVNAAGGLTIRPGVDNDNWVPPSPTTTEPFYGGDITITGGPYTTTSGPGFSAALTDGVNIVSALFGSFTGTILGGDLLETSPVASTAYQSEISNGSGTFTNFRNKFLGPNAAISTGIFSATNLIDYAQKIIDETSQDYLQAQSSFENEDTLRGIIQRQFSDESGVNIDEEMSNLIVVQTAYAAAARTITAADEMFQELINSIRR